MRFELAFAGIPTSFYDRVYSQKSSFIGSANFFGKPLRDNAGYYTEYAQEFVNHFGKLVSGDHENRLSETGFAVIAVSHDPASTELLRRALFPSIYCAIVDWAPTWGSKTQMRISANELVASLRETTSRVKFILTLLKEELTSRSNSTPLLLPIKNFSSPVLGDEIRGLHHYLHRAQDPDGHIREAIARIRQSHPFERVSDSPKKAYVDDRDIVYASPGQNRHGFARPNSGHPISCVLAGKRRLGAPYDHAFHYDCTKVGQARLKGNFLGCHEPAMEYTGNPHLNIAPNDNVRA